MTAPCPHECTDGWLLGPQGHVERCPWCATRHPATPMPIELFEPAGRQGIADARQTLAGQPDRREGPFDDEPDDGLAHVPDDPDGRTARLRARADARDDRQTEEA